MTDNNVGLVRRWFEEVWNQRREEVIDEMLTSESVCHANEVRGLVGRRDVD